MQVRPVCGRKEARRRPAPRPPRSSAACRERPARRGQNLIARQSSVVAE